MLIGPGPMLAKASSAGCDDLSATLLVPAAAAAAPSAGVCGMQAVPE